MPEIEKDQLNKEMNTNIDSAVVTSENGKKQIINFIDFLESSNDKNAVKLRNLRQYISDEELITIYQDVAGTITSEEELDEYLTEIFISAANHINQIPNGIVIDLSTGLKDESKSFEEAVNVRYIFKRFYNIRRNGNGRVFKRISRKYIRRKK